MTPADYETELEVPEYKGATLDVSKKYRIEVRVPPYRRPLGDETRYADDRPDAQFHAGELSLKHPDGIVEVIKQLGRPRRWKARLIDGEGCPCVMLDELFSDPFPSAYAEYWSKRQAKLTAMIDQEREARKRRREARREEQATKRAVGIDRALHYWAKPIWTLNPRRRFESIKQAADFFGVKRQAIQNSIKRRRKCAGFRFTFKPPILKEAA